MSAYIKHISSKEEFGYVTQGIILTDGLGPCIGIGIVDKEREIGYVIHIDDLEFSDIEFYLEQIFEHSSRENLDVFATGIGVFDGDEKENIERLIERRENAEVFLKEHFLPENVLCKWSPYNHAAEVSVDTKSGKISHRFSL